MFLFDATTDRWFGLCIIAGLTLFGVIWWFVAAIRDRKRAADLRFEALLGAYCENLLEGMTSTALAVQEIRYKALLPERQRQLFTDCCRSLRAMLSAVEKNPEPPKPEDAARRMIERNW